MRPQLSPHQFGFLSNRSCLTNLLTTYTAISKSLDKGHTTDVVYLDFAKAFDTLPHTKLLYKLWRIGITGPLWLWFRGYLEGRQHFVQIYDTQSSRLPVLSGVWYVYGMLFNLSTLIYLSTPSNITSLNSVE